MVEGLLRRSEVGRVFNKPLQIFTMDKSIRLLLLLKGRCVMATTSAKIETRG
jgi:hypothetical protein